MQVYSCAVLRDPGSGLNRGYGFIKFKSKEIAQKAMTKLNDTEMKDHPGMKVPTSSPPASPACRAALPSGVHVGFHMGSAGDGWSHGSSSRATGGFCAAGPIPSQYLAACSSFKRQPSRACLDSDLWSCPNDPSEGQSSRGCLTDGAEKGQPAGNALLSAHSPEPPFP